MICGIAVDTMVASMAIMAIEVMTEAMTRARVDFEFGNWRFRQQGDTGRPGSRLGSSVPLPDPIMASNELELTCVAESIGCQRRIRRFLSAASVSNQ